MSSKTLLDTDVDVELKEFENSYKTQDFSQLLDNARIDSQTIELNLADRQEAKAKTRTHLNISLRMKLIIAVYATIVVLLGALLIYNAVSIGNYRESIAQKSALLEVEQAKLDSLEEILANVNGVTPEDIGMSKIDSNNITKLKKLEKLSKVDYVTETNWFDKVCEFISAIFGG